MLTASQQNFSIELSFRVAHFFISPSDADREIRLFSFQLLLQAYSHYTYILQEHQKVPFQAVQWK